MTTILRTCHLCEAMCGLRFEVEGDRIVDVKNDPDDPFSCGFCCERGVVFTARPRLLVARKERLALARGGRPELG